MNGLKNIYKVTAVIFFSVTILFLAVNVVSYFILKERMAKAREEELESIYEMLPEIINYESVKADFIENDSIYARSVARDFIDFSMRDSAFQYYPNTEYVSAPYVSEHINFDYGDVIHRVTLAVDSNNISAYKKAVFCFGGSTTFGSLVADEHTWPAWLMGVMNEGGDGAKTRVVNYGNSGYTVTQETMLFLDLLKRGHRPSVAIFMDGVNTGPVFDASEFSLGISERFNNRGITRDEIPGTINLLPVMQLIRGEYYKLDKLETDVGTSFPFELSSDYNDEVANRFVVNAKLRAKIGELFGVRVIQFLQPNVFVNYDLTLLTEMQRSKADTLQLKNFRELYKLVREANAGYVDLSGLFDSYGKKPALVDGLHYSPAFNYFIARNIYEQMKKDSLGDYYFDSTQSTGVAFPLTEVE